MANRTILDDKLHWYKDAVIYELHIKAFFDSNNDGIGDFNGLLQKLDYLQDLGVTAIWLLPFYPSPLRDDGYDIADYYSINPSYGTIEQFQQLLEEAHKRNLKVITELVINHTSDQHPWFQRARRAPKGSSERDYYVWTDDPNQFKDVRIIFQDFESSNWTWDPVAQQYYWHRFFHHQPDLNFDNELVQEEVFKIIDYWCAMGVDGFRLDAVPYLYEREGTNGENLPETHAFLKKLRAYIEQRYPQTCFLAEANMWPEDSASYFGEGDECHMNYHFPVMPRMFMALQREDRYPITDIFDQTPAIPDTCQWAMFLRNHDELTLEMVTDEERDYMYKVYAKDPKAKINLGIRHRLAPLMENDRKKIELMKSLLFSLPGTPVIYYGDEIGMGDNFYLGDRDGVRTPMQWSPDRNAGFSDTNPQKLYLPVIIDPQYHYESINVETQRANTSSLFWFMKRIINMRKKYKVFGRGDFHIINVDNPKVLAFTRQYEDETLLIVVNLSKYSQPAELDLEAFTGFTPYEAFSKNPFPVIKQNQSYLLTMSPHSYHWFILEKTEAQILPHARKRQMAISSWDDLFTSKNIEILETEMLPQYISKTNWFIGKMKKVDSVTIKRKKLLDGVPETYLMLIEVSFETGLPEHYFLPVAFLKGRKASALKTDHANAVIAEVKFDGKEGLLCDALFVTEVQVKLLELIAGNTSSIDFRSYPREEVKRFFDEEKEIKPKVHEGEQLNTSITFNNKLFLKVYRRVDPGINPDAEISHFLSEDCRFKHTPPFLSVLDWKLDNETITIAMLEVMIENHGNGESFMMERINNYIERILARDRSTISAYPRLGSFISPIGFEELNDEMKEFLSGSAGELARLIGERTAQLHQALTDKTSRDFQPEPFSLHYQRSLFAGMQSIVRETFDTLAKRKHYLPSLARKQADYISTKKQEISDLLKRIYQKKFDVLKTRIHGLYGLEEVLLTGKDVMLHNFNGNPLRSFSERRLRRSPLRDVAAMVRSFYYVAYKGFSSNTQIRKEELPELLPYADFWAYYMSSFFLKAYMDKLGDNEFIPKDPEDATVMIETYLIENALHYLNFDLKYRPENAIAPLMMIETILQGNIVTA